MAEIAIPLYPSFKVSRTIKDELPETERTGAAESLLRKSSGRCALCNEPLNADGTGIEIDHFVARQQGDGGPTQLSNLYLAHKECNNNRKNLPFELASRIIKFWKWSRAHSKRTFEDVIKDFVADGNQRVGVVDHGDEIELVFGTDRRKAPVYIDPATSTRYFFMNAPTRYIQNDDQTQPRVIQQDHVRTLAVDFSKHPVHEPSNCRVVLASPDIADLLQFDGQHKTTAQIVLGRDEVPMKFYFEPNLPMIQELVVQIQQGIKKRPLSTSDTLRKLDDVIRDKVEEYRSAHDGVAPTEIQLVQFQPRQDQAAFKKRLLSNFEYAVLDTPDFALKGYYSPKKDRQFPLTDTVLVNKLIHPLISQELVDEPLDAADKRDNERETVVWILNLIAEQMLVDKWMPKPSGTVEDLLTQRARTFFYQGAIGWWLNEVFMVALSLLIPRPKWKLLFLEDLDSDQQDRIEAFISTLTSWPIWSTEDEGELAAFRSNTVSKVAAVFPEYNQTRLIKDSQNE